MDINKKILLISSWAPPMIGGPQNLYNIFSNFNNNSYSILSSLINIKQSQKNGVSGSSLGGEYYFYDDNALQWQDSIEQNNKINRYKIIIFTISNFPIIGKYLKIFLGLCFIIFKFTKKALWIVKNKNIDILIGVSDEGQALLTTFLIHKITKKPYFIYFFDIYRENLLSWPFKFIARIIEKPLIKNAAMIILTNEGTEKYFKKLYDSKIKTIVIHNSIIAEAYENIQTPYQPCPPYQIVFTGNLNWPQERSVRNLITAVSEINDIDVKLLLYVPSPPQDLVETYKNHPKIKFDVAPQSEMPRIQSGADILFLPFAWRTPSPQIIATASPGKLTDYLASGRPILIHAPPYAYVSQYAKEYGFAHIVDEESIPLLQDGIRKLLQDHDYSRKLIKNARELFLKNHDAVKNAELLKKIINEL